jgi:transcriptional regulator with XRE-family HTH domain
MTEREFDGASLGRRIKLLRAARRMSLDEVGAAAGLTKSHVWELEQGRSRNPTVNAVWGLARALSVSPAAILGLDDSMPPLHPKALEVAGMVDRALRGAAAEALCSTIPPVEVGEDSSLQAPAEPSALGSAGNQETREGETASCGCHADRDGDCRWAECPQLRDDEPATSSRHCPLDTAEEW